VNRRWLLAVLLIPVVGPIVWRVTHKVALQRSPALPAIASTPASADPNFKANITYDEARPALEAFRKHLPSELKSKSPPELEAVWPGWVTRRNAEIRARLVRGDEDSIFNFWLYGTTFTKHARVTNRDAASPRSPAETAELLQGRLSDLIAGIAPPGDNDRLRFVRETIKNHGIDPTTASGRDKAWDYLNSLRTGAIAENDRYLRAGRSARQREESARASALATLFQDRGLSSDTRIDVDFSIDQALQFLAAKGVLAPRSVRRIAIYRPWTRLYRQG
jgi:hypothetical protein